MALDAQLIDPVTGNADPDFSVGLELQQHARLFAHPDLRPENFPLLSRIHDFYEDASYTTDELESLIHEVERAAILFKTDGVVHGFTGPFHTLCCMAFLRNKHVALHAD
jgi:hypothetical protein